MKIVHLTASRFFGGPERQMLGLAEMLRPAIKSAFIAFYEDGLYQPFLAEVKRRGFEGYVLKNDTPQLFAALRELVRILRIWKADILLCHNTKPNLLGLLAARWIGIPVISVSRGWTEETVRVRIADAIDRRLLCWVDWVICVSQSQAKKVRAAGVQENKITVIHNAICPERFSNLQTKYLNRLRKYFPEPPARIVGAAGRLSPEKGFSVLIDAAAEVVSRDADVGFVLFGDGPLQESLARQIALPRIAENIHPRRLPFRPGPLPAIP